MVDDTHLRDDAPYQRCDRCGRKTWSVERFGTEHRMKQSDGYPCGGMFRPTIQRTEILARELYVMRFGGQNDADDWRVRREWYQITSEAMQYWRTLALRFENTLARSNINIAGPSN